MRYTVIGILILLPLYLGAQAASGPVAMPSPPAIPAPRDQTFSGTVQLIVDATDTAHGVFHVTESIPVQAPGKVVLFYPEWETTSHAPTASVVELAGLHIQADAHELEWRRDTVDVHAFHVTVPSNTHALNVSFDYLSPRSTSQLRTQMIDVQWQRLLLYPAGWYTRDIAVVARLRHPTGLRAFSALTPIKDQSDMRTADNACSGTSLLVFAPETLDRLVDAPVYLARYAQQLDLTTAPQKPVYLDLVADSPGDLVIAPLDLAQLRELIVQTEKVFGPAPFPHYDVLASLSNDLSPGGGLEHLEEGENNLPANYLTNGAQQLNNRDLIAHEYVHAWNGRYRQPASLWSPNFNRPTDPSLLWVYEGQTEFWGRVLAARSGMRTYQQTLDKLALDSALVANRPGREWKTLADSSMDAIYMPGHAVAWRDWQRREDYYPEGVLLWLDVDARMREISHGRLNLDDFAHRFFATNGRAGETSTYTFEDVCDVLNALVPLDWESFLNHHLFTHSTADAIAGLARAGWRLTYSAIPTETFLQNETESGVTDLDGSIGAQLLGNGNVRSVVWDGPAFQAGLAPGVRISKVNGQPFTPTALIEAVSNSTITPIRFTVGAEPNSEVTLSYAGPLRYPHLERIPNTTDHLTSLLRSH